MFLFKFGNTVLSIYKSILENSEDSAEDSDIVRQKGDGRYESCPSVLGKMDAKSMPMFG